VSDHETVSSDAVQALLAALQQSAPPLALIDAQGRLRWGGAGFADLCGKR
jgi:hypothetical protein